MKQILLLALAALPLSALAQNKATRKTYNKEFKKEFIDACVTAATKDGNLSEKMARQTCNCSFERLADTYTMNQVSEMSSANGEQARALILEATAPCREELLRKLNSQ